MFLVLAVFCVLIEAIFTALEVALNASSRTRLRALSADFASEMSTQKENVSVAIEYSNLKKTPLNRAAATLQLLENPTRLSLMFLTVTSLTMWTASSAIVWHGAFAGWNWMAQVGALILVLWFAEVLPLLIASRHPERVAMRGVRWIAGAQRVLDPLIVLLQSTGKLGATGLGATANASSGVTPHELRTALATAEEEGVLESDERALLEGAMDFREKQARHVMTPQAEIIAVRDSDSLLAALQIAMRDSHSRLPVVDENARVVGIVAAKDLIPHRVELFGEAQNRRCVRDIMRVALWVEENRPVAQVLETLRRQRSLMAIVGANDEAVGIVTLEDLLEEIVGEIQDEYDDEAPPILLETDELTNNELTNDEITENESANAKANANANANANINDANTESASDQSADGEIAKDENVNVLAGEKAARDENVAASSSTQTRRILCEGDTKLREVQRFWRETFGENVRFQIGETQPPSSLSLRELAEQLFAPDSQSSDETSATKIVCGARTNAGFATPLADGKSETEALRLQLEIVKTDGARIEKVRLFCADTET